MKRESLDLYDYMPEDLKNYLRYYGRHFNKKLCEFAVSKMESDKPINYIDKNTLDKILKENGVNLKNNSLYDYVYVANMVKADFWGSSIEDDRHLALYVKDVIEDPDGYDGLVWNRWYADSVRKGIPVEWSDML